MTASTGILRMQADGLDGDDLADRDVRVEELRVGRGDHDVGVGDPVEAAAAADAVDRGDHRLPHLLVPRREVQIEVGDAVVVALHALAVGGDLGDVDTGLERAAVAGVHDDPHLGIVVELDPRIGELVAHQRVHRVELVGPVVDQPAHVAVAFDDQRLVAAVSHRSPLCVL